MAKYLRWLLPVSIGILVLTLYIIYVAYNKDDGVIESLKSPMLIREPVVSRTIVPTAKADEEYDAGDIADKDDEKWFVNYYKIKGRLPRINYNKEMYIYSNRKVNRIRILPFMKGSETIVAIDVYGNRRLNKKFYLYKIVRVDNPLSRIVTNRSSIHFPDE